MIKSSPEGISIRERLFRASLIEDPATSTIRERKGRQVYFRTIDDIFVRYDVEPDRYYVLDRRNVQFVPKPDVVPLPLVPDTTRCFSADDLLRDKTYKEWCLSFLSQQGPSTIVGPVLGPVGGALASGALIFITPLGPPVLAAATAYGPTAAYLGAMAGSGVLVGGFIERRLGRPSIIPPGPLEQWIFGPAAEPDADPDERR